MPIKIVDAQVHLWGANTPERPWPQGQSQPQRERVFTRQDLLAEMRAAGVDRAVIVPPSWEGCRNDLGIEAARLYPDKFAVMGRLDLKDPASPALIAAWKKQPGMLGVRLTFHTAAQRPWLTDGTTDWFWPAAEKTGIAVMIYTPGEVKLVAPIAERYRGLKLIIDHMAISRGAKDDAAFAHIDELCSFARFANVAVKVTSLPTYSDEAYPHPKLHQYVRRMYDAFGPKRLFWGSDLTRMLCSYRLCKTMFTEEMRWMTGDDLEWIMGRGVCEWLGWPLPE